MCGFSVETDLVGSPLCMVLQSCMMCESLDSVGTPSSGTGHGSWVMGCVMFWDTVRSPMHFVVVCDFFGFSRNSY